MGYFFSKVNRVFCRNQNIWFRFHLFLKFGKQFPIFLEKQKKKFVRYKSVKEDC